MAKILLVDDEEDFLSTLNVSLTENGFQTHCLYSGYDALSYLRQHNDIDCILSDYYMPALRGDELAKMIRNEWEIPIIIMTSDPNIQYQKIYRSGISGVMTKPINANSFIDLLKSNHLHIYSDQVQQRKYLRGTFDTTGMNLAISNGREQISAEITNLSTQGLGIRIVNEAFTMSTVQFILEKNQESIKGYMHCRWRSGEDNKLMAGFEFDSTTKQFLSENELFHKWINFK